MTRRTAGVLAGAFLLSLVGTSSAAAQGANDGPKLEVGLFPLGGTFFVGGDGNREVDFNVYTSGGHLTYFFDDRLAVEGELSISFGLAQDVTFQGATVHHAQMPHVWGYAGNLLFFPAGTAGKGLPLYVTGGVGIIALQSRDLTSPFGYDKDTVGFEQFLSENVGAGVEMFRRAVPNWGFRADYRYLIVNSNDDAPAFFAHTKTRGGHRVYFGVLYRH